MLVVSRGQYEVYNEANKIGILRSMFGLWFTVHLRLCCFKSGCDSSSFTIHFSLSLRKHLKMEESLMIRLNVQWNNRNQQQTGT